MLDSVSEATRTEKWVLLVVLKVTADFPDVPVVKNPPAKAGDMGSIPDPGKSHMPQST